MKTRTKRKVEFTAGQYYKFCAWARKVFGFSFISKTEFDEIIHSALDLRKRKTDGQWELGLILRMNDCTILVWTTFLPGIGKQRGQDVGWVIIIQNNKIVYSSPKILRTKNFFHTMEFYTQKAYEMVYSNPMCVKCQRFLRIVMPELEWENGKPKRLGERWRACPNEQTRHSKRDRPRAGIDNGLSEHILLQTKKVRKKKKYRRDRANEQGKTYGISRIQRSQRKKGKSVFRQ